MNTLPSPHDPASVSVSPLTAQEGRPPQAPPVLSLVFPIFNEEAVLPHLFARLDTVVADLQAIAGAVEIIFVNDGSRDRSLAMLREYAKTRPYMRILCFSRNFGLQVAV